MGGIAWTKEEDHLLKKCIQQNGEGKWQRIPLLAGLNRCPKSCRLRWVNYLRPNIRRGTFTEEEIDLIIKLHRLLGNRWSLIAGRLPGRTGNDVKNYWNCHLSKKVNNEAKKDRQTVAKVARPQPRYSATITVEPAQNLEAPNLRPPHGESSSSTTPLQCAEVEERQVLQKEGNDQEDDIMLGGPPIDFYFEQIGVTSESSNKWNLDDLIFDMQI